MHPFQKQAVEDSQLKVCVVDEVTQQTGHVKISFFNACSTDMNQNMLHSCSVFIVKKEAYFVLRWNIEVHDTDYPLVENRTLSKMDITRMLMPKYDKQYNQCKNNKVKWPCLEIFCLNCYHSCVKFLFRMVFIALLHVLHTTQVCI